MKKKILDIVTKDNCIINRRLTESYIKKNEIDTYNLICNHYSKLNITFSEMLYLILNDLIKPAVCKICGKRVRFKKISEGYSTYCSLKCIGLDSEIQEKRENTTFKAIGYKHVFSSPEKRKEVISNNLKNHGVEHLQQLDEVKEKTKQTYLKKHGVEHHFQLKSQIEKRNITNKNIYGTTNPMQNEEIKKKSKETIFKKYGTTSVMKNKDILNKAKETNMKRYGVECTLQNVDVNNKSKATIFNKYGVTSYSKTDEFKLIVKKTKKEKYNDENYNNINKIKSTSKIKYGCENPAQNIDIINKIKSTTDSNYKNKYSKLLNIKASDIIIKDSDVILNNYCDKHDSFEISKSLLFSRLIEHSHENICTKCNEISKNVSIVEGELKKFINSLNVLFIENYTLFEDKSNVDIYLPNNKLAIEFNGLYWHSELFKDKNYHLNKTKDCNKLGILLLHIFEDEWIYKKNIVKSIIKSKLNLIEDKIYARQCEIIEIENAQCEEFLNINHIQGNVTSKIKLGLFHDNELVSVMCFEKTRIGLGNKTNSDEFYNLNRFCNKINTSVIGGASKLLKYFIYKYKPKNIITYADRRYSRGELYEKLGFNMVLINKPSYSYYNQNKNIRQHRFNYRKSKLIKCDWYDFNKTVNENLIMKKIIKIYDSGTIKYVMNL